MTKIVYIGGGKGGSGKTTTAHLACLGAILLNQPAAYVLTDPERKLRAEGRPYGVLDGRRPEQLAQFLNASHDGADDWLFVDGGGNRPAFDSALCAEAHLCLLPFCASEEDLDTVANDLQRLPNSVAWPTQWATNSFAERSARFYIDGLAQAFPGRVITNPIPFVNSVSELLANALGAPSTPARQIARMVFFTIEDWFLDHLNIDMGDTSAVNKVASKKR
jgi:chromosome partitioning protein